MNDTSNDPSLRMAALIEARALLQGKELDPARILETAQKFYEFMKGTA